jgi:hypothetical protein
LFLYKTKRSVKIGYKPAVIDAGFSRSMSMARNKKSEVQKSNDVLEHACTRKEPLTALSGDAETTSGGFKNMRRSAWYGNLNTDERKALGGRTAAQGLHLHLIVTKQVNFRGELEET